MDNKKDICVVLFRLLKHGYVGINPAKKIVVCSSKVATKEFKGLQDKFAKYLQANYYFISSELDNLISQDIIYISQKKVINTDNTCINLFLVKNSTQLLNWVKSQ